MYCGVCAVAASPLAAEEQPAGDFFETCLQARDSKPEQAAKLYEQFASKNPDAPEAVISHVLRGIVLWRDLADMNKAEEAFTFAAAAAGQDKLSTAASTLGKKWRARIQMTRIARACHSYYLDEVAYPDNLAQLVEKNLLEATDLRDPWNEPFVYAPVDAKFVKSAKQGYRLSSKNADGDASKIGELLSREKGFVKAIALKGITMEQPRTVMVTLKNESLIIEEGKTKGGLTVALIDTGRAILFSPDYVVVLAR